MTYRTDASAVAKIIELDEEIDLEPFIEAANSIVEEVCTNSGYSEERLELIERWLSAHFYAVRDPRAATEGVKGITARYEGVTGKGLEFTRYGQMAMLLDTAGNLKALDAMKFGIKAQILHVGGSSCNSSSV